MMNAGGCQKLTASPGLIYSRKAATSSSLGRESQDSGRPREESPGGATSLNVNSAPIRPRPTPHDPRVFPQPRPSDKMPNTHPNEGSKPDFATTCRVENRWVGVTEKGKSDESIAARRYRCDLWMLTYR